MELSRINDIRTSSDFKTETFSGFKKTEVKKQLLLNLMNGKVEQACYWCAELICAGHFMDIWESILYYMAKHIHLANPKIPIYLEKRFIIFKNIMQQGMHYDELELRNNSTIREMFAEIICVLACSPKKHSFEPIKINRIEEFDITQIPEKLKAPNVQFAEPIFQKEDPKELWIAINEFAYHLSNINGHIPNMMLASYWIEWIIDFDVICKNKKKKCICERRTYTPVEFKFQKETIWLIWDVLLLEMKNRSCPFLEKIMNALFQLFCVKYLPTSNKKRRYLLYYAVALLTEHIPIHVDMISNKPLLETVISKINTIYKQIKKNEHSPNMDYLFSGMDVSKQNREKSIQKIQMLGNFDPAFHEESK
jgi:hypothetical protein